MEELVQLKQLVDGLSPLSDEDWKAFAKIWKPIAVKRKTALTAAGQTEKYLYFVTSGVQRIYHLDANNKETTILFTYGPSFSGVLDSLMLQTPSKYQYETLSTSSFLRAHYADLKPLMEHHLSIASFVRDGLAGALSGTLARLVELQCLSSEEKFRTLLKRSPHLLQLVPHKYLASYIGIDVTNFSKFINSIVI